MRRHAAHDAEPAATSGIGCIGSAPRRTRPRRRGGVGAPVGSRDVGAGARRRSSAASSASTSARRAQSRATRTRVVLVGEVAGLVLAGGVVERPAQEVPLVGQVPALVAARRSAGRRSTLTHRLVLVGSTAGCSAARSASNWRPRRQNSTPTPPSAPTPSTSGMTQMTGTPPASGGTSRMVSPYSETSTWSIFGGRRGPRPPCSRSGGARRWPSTRSTAPPRGRCTTGSARRPRWPRPAAAAVSVPARSAPLPMTSATARTASGSATRAHSGSRAGAQPSAARRARRPAPAAGTCRGSAGSPGPRAPRSPGPPGRSRRSSAGGHPVAVGDGAAGVADGRPQVAVRAQEALRRRRACRGTRR